MTDTTLTGSLPPLSGVDDHDSSKRTRALLAATADHTGILERSSAIDAYVDRKVNRLAALRKAIGLTQQEIATELKVTQAEVSKLEGRESYLLSTLAKYIAATGGRLRIVAEYEDIAVELEPAAASGHEIQIDGEKVVQARKAAGIDLKELLARLNNSGSALTGRQLFQIERERSISLGQFEASALVAALETRLDDIRTDDSLVNELRAFLESDEFEHRIREWASERGRDVDATRTYAQRELQSINRRASDVHSSQLMELLEAVLRHMP